MPVPTSELSCEAATNPNCTIERSATEVTNRYVSKALYYLWVAAGE